MRIVLDTNILARANPRSSGSARVLVELIRGSAEHSLIVSPFLLAELERVLNYPRLQAMWPLSPLEIAGYVQTVARFAECVVPGGAHAQIAADPKDDPVLDTAVFGRAQVLCTLDRHFASETVRGYARENGIEVMTDVELLRRLKSRIN